MPMKYQFLKSVVVLGTMLALVNCGEDAAEAINNLDPSAVQPTEDTPNAEVAADKPCWLLNADQPYLIYPAGIVTDVNGTVVGTFVLDGETTGTIVAVDGETVLVNTVDTNDLPITDRATVTATTPATTTSSASTSTQNPPTTTQSSATGAQTTLSSGTETTPVASSSSEQTVSNNSSSSEQQQQAQSSATASNNQCNNQCYDNVSGKCVDYYAEQTGSKGEKYAFDNSCGVKCYYDPDNKDCKNISGSAPASSASQQAKSSSSQQQQQKSSSSQQQQQKSSSSSAKSSSSVKSSSSYSQQITTNFKVKNGGRSGQGWGSRYWDCCMPHCAWSGNTANPTKTCNAQMQEIGESGGSVCSGGSGGVCDMQAPWAANDNLAFAFAAVPAGLGGECGKCFLLTFDGKTHNGGANANTSGLNGKQMVIMVSNIGGDVGSNQFDIMIPGGGVGKFNGCGTQLGINSTGAQYGGFITDCKSDPSCVKQKCSVFSKYPKLQAGCEFSATWMGGANNPSFKFEELESCPSEISSKW